MVAKLIDDRLETGNESSCSLIEVLFRYLSGETKENYDKRKSREAVSRSSFEPSTSRIQIRSFTTTPARSIFGSLFHSSLFFSTKYSVYMPVSSTAEFNFF
jgi:hypothetical protein